jgi:hypothetical protein
VAATWLQVRVDLEGGRDLVCDPRPGRIFMVGPRHTFADLAEAIDLAFARWDRSHLHVFDLPDGRRVGFAEVDPGEHEWLDHETLRVARELRPGARFSYTFDLGDDWRHLCEVLDEKADPRLLFEAGQLPSRPVAIWGWGWIPDQYGRESFED